MISGSKWTGQTTEQKALRCSSGARRQSRPVEDSFNKGFMRSVELEFGEPAHHQDAFQMPASACHCPAGKNPILGTDACVTIAATLSQREKRRWPGFCSGYSRGPPSDRKNPR